MAAAAEGARAVEKLGLGRLSDGSDDAAADGGDVAGCRDEASGAADMAECLHADWVVGGLRYGSRFHACDTLAHVCRPPRHWPPKRKK